MLIVLYCNSDESAIGLFGFASYQALWVNGVQLLSQLQDLKAAAVSDAADAAALEEMA